DRHAAGTDPDLRGAAGAGRAAATRRGGRTEPDAFEIRAQPVRVRRSVRRDRFARRRRMTVAKCTKPRPGETGASMFAVDHFTSVASSQIFTQRSSSPCGVENLRLAM